MLPVTITGADDQTGVSQLIELSTKFPFVEWGILIDQSKQGTARYPSLSWRRFFLGSVEEARRAGIRVNYATHLCNASARKFLATMQDEGMLPSRIQINLGTEPPPATVDVPYYAEEVIFQCSDERLLPEYGRFVRSRRFERSILFDASRGRGVAPATWPTAPLDCRMGYAGGITPSNVESVLHALKPHNPPWIDMESGVRSDNKLDLDLVVQVLERVARWLASKTSPSFRAPTGRSTCSGETWRRSSSTTWRMSRSR